MKLSKLAKILAIPIMFSSSYSLADNEVKKPNIFEIFSSDPNCKTSMEVLESKVEDFWSSNFLKDSVLLREEIGDNRYELVHTPLLKYTLYGKFFQNELPSGEFGDNILISDYLFCPSFISKLIMPPLEEILMHETLHDLWINVLTIDEKVRFSYEARLLYGAFNELDTDEDKEVFMLISDLVSKSKDFDKLFGSIVPKINAYLEFEDQHIVFGAEAFSFFGEIAYSKGSGIPENIREFYSNFLTDAALKGSKKFLK